MSKHLRLFKDPWKFFTALMIVILIVLVVLSQLWIFKASVQRDGGGFTIRTEKDSRDFFLEEETVNGFSIDSHKPDTLFISRQEKPLYSLFSDSENVFSIEKVTGDSFSIEKADAGEIVISSGKDRLWITQKVFTQLFESVSSPVELKVINAEGSRVSISYNAGAFLIFADKDKSYTLSNYYRFFTRSKYFAAIKNSLIVMLCSTCIAAFFGVGLAYFFARYKVPGTSLILTIITMASVSPPFLGAYAWRMLLGGSGIITRMLGLDWTIVGLHGVIWVVSWLIFPIIFLLTYDSFTSLDHSLRECSMSLGGNRYKTFFKVELPLAMPGIITGLYMGMMTAFTDFGTPYVISLDLDVLPVLIYKEYMSETGGNLSIASTGSMIMILFSSFILMAQRIYLAKRSYASVKTKQPSARLPGPLKKTAIISMTAFVLFLAFIPHITVTLSSFFEWKVGIITSQLTLDNFSRLFQSNLSSIGITLFTGTVATVITFCMGLGIAYVIVKKNYRIASDSLNILVMVPYLIPGTVLGIGFIMLFNKPPVLLTGTWVILVLAYVVRKLPYSVKSAESALYQVHNALEEAAKSLGAKPVRSFLQITLPLIVGGIISGATLSFLQIMTEISSTIILYRPPWKPMTAVIFENTIDAGADFGIASAMTVLLMAMLYIPLYFITIKTRKPKEIRIENI